MVPNTDKMLAPSRDAETPLNESHALELVRILFYEELVVERWDIVIDRLVRRAEWSVKLRALYKTCEYYECVLLTLQKWIAEAGQDATLENLVYIMKECGFNKIADDLLRNKGDMLTSQDEIPVISTERSTVINEFHLLRIVDILICDTIVLRNWKQMLDQLVTEAKWRMVTEALRTKCKFSKCIRLTLQRWIEEAREDATFENLIQKFQKCHFNRVAEKLLAMKVKVQEQQDEINKTPLILTEAMTEAFFANGEVHEDEYNIRPSEVDSESNRKVRLDYWIISMARKVNSEYAFVIVEGIHNGHAVIWFIDFLSKARYGIGTQPGKIRIFDYKQPIKEYLSMAQQDEHKKLVYSCEGEMMRIGTKEKFLSKSWEVSARRASGLVQFVERTKAKGEYPKYVITGKGTPLACAAAASKSEESGHNCLTSARALLLKLDDSQISAILRKNSEWLFYIPSQFLPDNNPTALAQQRYQTFAFGAIGAASVVLTFWYVKSA